MAETTLTFGPFMRCITTVEAHLCPPECIAEGSLNYLVDPVTGGAFKRSGFSTAGYGESLSAVKRATNGITESKPGWVPARLRSFKSDALADGVLGGYPTPSILYRKEASSTSWPTVDDGVFGTEYIRRAAANYVMLSDFGSNGYPTGGGAHGGEVKYKVAPLWYESGDGGYMRGATEFTRRFVASGSWSTLDAGRWRYYPNLRGTPMRWDGGCNDSSASMGNSVRVIPTGPLPPAWMPTLADTSSVAAASRTAEYPWGDGDAFYYSVLYQFEDGSYSAPVIPRQPNATLTSGYGWKVVGTPATSPASYYKSLVWSNIPIGPAGTIARVLLRTRKMVMTATTSPVTVDISDLRVCGVLRNNTQTTYTDTLADDDGLLLDDDVVRFDTICPPRARYIGTGDNRALVGYTLPNPLAIQIVCYGINAAADMNVDETATGNTAARVPCYRVTASGLDLFSVDVGGAAYRTTSIDWATYTTLQAVVDKINATVVDTTPGSEKYAFRAQIAPGADPTAASSGLARTVITSTSSTSAASTTLTVDAATGAAVPIGYKVYDSAGVIPTGAYVVSKQSATQLTLSAAASGAGSAAALEFYCDLGDNSCISNGRGLVRCFGSGLPQFVYFKRSALAGYDRPNVDRIYFTAGSPGAAATGVSLAPNLFVASNRRDGVNGPGQVMGIVDVQGAAVVLYRKRVALFVNERGSNTGEDFDYRMHNINESRGCVSPWSVVGVNGCAVYLTNIGIVATDKSRREILLTADMYQPVREKGAMAYEIPLCVAAAASDSPDCWMSGAVFGNRLVYSYRMANPLYAFSVYDFSLGMDAQGLESLASPDTRKPYGWSTVCYLDANNAEFGPRAMGAVSASDGLRLYGAINDNNGTTDGRYDRMFTGATDNGNTVTGTLNTRTVLADPNSRISAQSATILHKIGYAGASVNVDRSTGSTSGYSVTSAGAESYAQQGIEFTQAARSPGNRCLVSVDDPSTSTGGIVWRVDVFVDVLKAHGGD